MRVSIVAFEAWSPQAIVIAGVWENAARILPFRIDWGNNWRSNKPGLSFGRMIFR